MATDDPALETLLLPLLNGPLAWPADGQVPFLRARPHPTLRRLGPGAKLLCQQSFKPHADALTAAGFPPVAEVPAGPYPLVLALLPRQRAEARALLAQGVSLAGAEGRVVASLPNTEGAKSGEADLAALAGGVDSLSKNKSRVFWTTPGRPVDQALLESWAALDAPRPIAGGRFTSRPGLFAWDRLDPASTLLAQHLPAGLKGRAADLGAGFGYLSAELLARCPGITALDLYEAEARALDLARQNLAGAAVPLAFHWQDVTTGLGKQYDVIVSNPPFHVGRADDPGLGQAFVTAAAAALKPGGRFWLVANRHLPYEATLAKAFASFRTVVEDGGYKVLEAVKG